MSNSDKNPNGENKNTQLKKYIKNRYILSELERFCNNNFREAFKIFTPNDGLIDRADKLVEYCLRHSSTGLAPLQIALYRDRPDVYLKEFPTDKFLVTGSNSVPENRDTMADESKQINFNQENQKVGNQFNVAGDVHIRQVGNVYEKKEGTPTQEPKDKSTQPRLPSFEMVSIPAGHFLMGRPDNAPYAHTNETPRHRAITQAYSISRYPIINAQYAIFVQSASYSPPEHWHGKQPPELIRDHPITHVNHADAIAYCAWLSRRTGKIYRLPTESEWEKAASGHKKEPTVYPWGNEWEPTYCNSKSANVGITTPVDTYAETNRSIYGVVDMVGNVWEWTDSWYSAYQGNFVPSASYGQRYRVVRGGSWRNPEADCHVAGRGRYLSNTKRAYLGFRVITMDNINQ